MKKIFELLSDYVNRYKMAAVRGKCSVSPGHQQAAEESDATEMQLTVNRSVSQTSAHIQIMSQALS